MAKSLVGPVIKRYLYDMTFMCLLLRFLFSRGSSRSGSIFLCAHFVTLVMGTREDEPLTPAIHLLAGSFAGVANALVGQPLDTIKVKMQTFPSLYTSAIKCLHETVRSSGIRRGLYAGVGPAITANIAENSVLFCAYGFCQDIVNTIRGSDHADSTLSKAISGSCASIFSAFVICPTELVKCKLQALSERHPEERRTLTAPKLAIQIVRRDGVTGLFRGIGTTLMREIPGYFCFFGGYEGTKKLLTQGKPEEAGLAQTVIAGGVGGVCLWTICFPLDMVKSRIQVYNMKESTRSVLISVIRKEGIKGLYQGLSPALIRTFPSTGALFLTYEYTKDFLISQSVPDISMTNTQ